MYSTYCVYFGFQIYNYDNHKFSFAAQHVTSKQSSGGEAAGAQPGTSQVSESAGSAGNRILGMLKYE